MEVYRSLKKLQEDLYNKKITATTLTQQTISKILAQKELNAFIEVFEKSALSVAKNIDEKLAANQPLGKLFGLTIAIKDNIVYKGHNATASSKILDGFNSPYSATVVEKLLAEDAIIIGRTNCDEFAMGGSNENSYYGPVKNPFDIERVSGGSSGGSAAAVAADLCMAALGSDTGGSIRQPASFCGIVGLKPTYGRVSRYGLIAYGSSFDQIGPFTHSIEDAALLLEVISGADAYDATCSNKEVPDYSAQLTSGKKYKIAYYKNAIEHIGVNKEVSNASLQMIERLRSEGHQVDAIEFEELDYIVPAYYVLTTAEASSNLSRFDGVKYGYHAKEAHDLESTYKLTRSQGFGKEVQRRIMSGTFVLSAGYYDAYYSKAQKVRRIVAEKTKQTLETYDFILCPTAPTPAYKIGEVQDSIASFLGDIFTVQANIAGIPGISLPLYMSKSGLPIGIQFMAGRWQEEKLLAFSNSLL
ncbi:MAG TPA: Asp-tRNA(Asn)/Glu-tRNA(Gln) amidotransferase subunit GatA [Chitinophagales bacterium]|nr:Asp-tRNA(Asn)/Glu-tRNA(Gln) amidotransferase subunit GatA [Chitinophagales bacterium]